MIGKIDPPRQRGDPSRPSNEDAIIHRIDNTAGLFGDGNQGCITRWP